MVRVWHMDDSSENPQLEHHFNPPQYIPVEKLFYLARVEYWKIDVDNLENDILYKEIREKRGYKYEDELDVSRKTMLNYDAKMKSFYTEHFHEEEEIRLFLAGSAYFDVRDKDNKWIRILGEKGDLLVLPAGSYHRFTTDTNEYVKLKRLFCGNPVYKAIPRPAEDNPARIQYLNDLASAK
ncbi:hypothetical protein JTE90_008721 [Oedothorax gibbosus]|uniref:Acireductone dioxygenase n=1 Tax=Oedothorax gibbosus TaxID=931172 RepID=A0AAV6URF8_9ARAC|nr:hypothetical protein JTE90_008721 [Oedothorax gibbosus]